VKYGIWRRQRRERARSLFSVSERDPTRLRIISNKSELSVRRPVVGTIGTCSGLLSRISYCSSLAFLDSKLSSSRSGDLLTGFRIRPASYYN
jgi:hypothetical protein